MPVSNIRQVCRRFDVGRSQIYKLIVRDLFPRPRKMGRRSIWTDADLDAYEKNLPFASEIRELKPEKKQHAPEDNGDGESELPESLRR